MIIFRLDIVVALLLSIYAFPSCAFPAVSSTVSSTYTEVSSCSELTSRVDRNVCSHHLAAFKALIREKNNRLSLIPETVMIRKISATSERLSHEVFETLHPTLFIFDAEQLHEKKQPVVYELPLTEDARISHEGGSTFHLPDNSAFVGNRADILPVFVTQGVLQDHFVISATHSDSVYYLANIEIDSRNPQVLNNSSTVALAGSSELTPTKQNHLLAGVLNLMGAGIFVANNVKVVLDPADNQMRIKPVKLGCRSFAGGRASEVNFVYRFMNSEFDLLRGVKGRKDFQNAVLNVECFEKTGKVQLTMKNTKTVIFVPTDGRSYCSGIKIIQGAFGLKDREQAWGLIATDHNDKHSCVAELGNGYHTGFAPVSEWSETGFDVACNCTTLEPASSASSISPNLLTASPYTNLVVNISFIAGSDPDTGAQVINNEMQALTYQRAAIAVLILLDQAITHTWFFLSYHIKQAWIRHTSRALASIMGFGLPALQLTYCRTGVVGETKLSLLFWLLKDQNQL